MAFSNRNPRVFIYRRFGEGRFVLEEKRNVPEGIPNRMDKLVSVEGNLGLNL